MRTEMINTVAVHKGALLSQVLRGGCLVGWMEGGVLSSLVPYNFYLSEFLLLLTLLRAITIREFCHSPVVLLC